MRETTLVKANKQLVKQAHELGANVRRIVDLALEDYIRRNSTLKPEIKARKDCSNQDCDRRFSTMETKTADKSQVSAYHSSSDLCNPNSSSFSRFGLPSVSQPRIP